MFGKKLRKYTVRPHKFQREQHAVGYSFTIATKSSDKKISQDLQVFNQRTLKKMLWLRTEKDSTQTQKTLDSKQHKVTTRLPPQDLRMKRVKKMLWLGAEKDFAQTQKTLGSKQHRVTAVQ